MILDKLLMFSIAQPITVTAVSADVIDLQNARDLSVGDNPAMKVLCQVGTALTGGTSVQVQVQGSTDNTTFYTMAESIANVTAALTAGAELCNMHLPGPNAGQAIPRYLRLNYVVAGTYGAGTVNAGLVLDKQRNIAYPAGLNVTP